MYKYVSRNQHIISRLYFNKIIFKKFRLMNIKYYQFFVVSIDNQIIMFLMIKLSIQFRLYNFNSFLPKKDKINALNVWLI